MTKIANSLTELIGKTPLLKLNNYAKKRDLQGNILAKLEFFNPASSIKDRVAFNMIEDAEKKCILREGATVIEPTSGNTGIGLAWVCAIKNYRLILTMPETMSVERIKLVKQYGAEVILTKGELGMKGAILKAEEIRDNTPGSFIPQQFDNYANVEAHKKTTAIELLTDTGGDIDYFVAGVGTGGTLTGNAEVIKEAIPNVKIIAVEPFNSPLLSKGHSGAHGLMGIGANFVPNILNVKIIDEIITVTDKDAIETAKILAKEEGILVGITSGAAVYAATQIAMRSDAKGKNIVTILPDTGERYLSTSLFD